MIAPILETERLTLRGHRVTDLPDCYAMWSDPAVTRFIGTPSTEQRTWFRLLNYAGHWTLMDFGYWVVEEKASRRFVGEVGFADFKRGLGPETNDVPELGWSLAKPFHGKGYATEAVRAAVAWGAERLRSRTVCLIDPENVASVRVAEKCGFTAVKRISIDEHPTLLFERP